MIYTLTSSTGGELGVRLERSAEKKENGQCLSDAVSVRAVSISHETGWLELSLDDLKRTKGEPFFEIERQRVLTSEPLVTLQAVLREYRSLESKAFEALRGQFGETSSLFRRTSWMRAGDCTVLCFRAGSLVPIFICDDGSNLSEKPGCCSRSMGVWLVPSCGARIICDVPCSEFSSGGTAYDGDGDGHGTIIP